jgi:hypothetical protein
VPVQAEALSERDFEGRRDRTIAAIVALQAKLR